MNSKTQVICIRILLAIKLILGFKVGTAPYLFYNLDRFSVDLDIDLLNTTKENIVQAWSFCKKLTTNAFFSEWESW